MTLCDLELIEPMTYDAYRAYIDGLVVEGGRGMQLDDAALNAQRMRRLDRTLVLVDELDSALSAIRAPQTWIVLSEGSCGDSAQLIPIFARAAASSARVTLSVILRDVNPLVMDRFLTSGTRSVPIVIVTDSVTGHVLGTWGPRPEAARELVAEFKRAPVWDKQQMLAALHAWYAKDKTASTQQEFAALLRALMPIA